MMTLTGLTRGPQRINRQHCTWHGDCSRPLITGMMNNNLIDEALDAINEAQQHAQEPCDGLAGDKASTTLRLTSTTLTDALTVMRDGLATLHPHLPTATNCCSCLDIECHVFEAIAAVDYWREQ